MPSNESPAAYADIRAALDRALASSNGVLIHAQSHGHAVNLRQRCYTYRKIERRESRKMYKESDSRFDRTPYDGLVVTIVENTVYIKPVREDSLNIEEIQG